MLSGGTRGEAVYAGSYIRRREVVLDASLLARRGKLARILMHELFHFIWVRLPNAFRRSWEAILSSEFRARARGELGWSAERRKRSLNKSDAALRTRRWREYACESFCDTGAWFTTDARGEATLASTRRYLRRAWFRKLMERPLAY